MYTPDKIQPRQHFIFLSAGTTYKTPGHKHTEMTV